MFSMDKMKFESPDMTAQNIDRIAALFPNCITEMLDEERSTPEKKVYKRAVNFELLKQMLSPDVVDGDEAYEFTWVGKKAAIVEANKPIRKTLRPCVAESKDWDTTENLYIEGDNLEVLKLLQESYLGKVKMIYIDPPYNTGNDFIYADDFMRSQEEENEQMGMYDEDENRLFKNTDTNGRFHSDWCSMIYSRLMLARNLLTDDGVIFISIDDGEVENLRKICDEVLGVSNFVACLVYDKNRKNDAKYFSVGHEYMLVYFKSAQYIYEHRIIFREAKEGVEEVKSEFQRLRELYNDDWDAVNDGLKKLYASWPKDDARKSLARFTKVDEYGPYRDDGNISWPGGGGPRYDVIHPVTGKPCKVPSRGWVYPNIERMQEEIRRGRVVFGKDHTVTPKIRTNLFEQNTEVMRSVQFSYAQTATQQFNKLFDGKRIFENPKNTADIKKLLAYITSDEADGIILDFFSGSATTAHAVMQLNAEDGGHRKFIMVQLPEKCDETSEAYKAGYKNICEIGKERIRRAGERIIEGLLDHGYSSKKLREDGTRYQIAIRREDDTSNDPNYISDPEIITGTRVMYDEPANRTEIQTEMAAALDIGFRVLKLDDTNMKDVYYAPDDYDQGMLAGLESNIKDDRTDLDLLFGCLIDWGLPLSLPYKSEKIDGCTVHTYNDGDLIACFDANIPESVVKEIAKRKPLRAVFRDSGFASSPEKINVFEIFKLYMPEDAGDISKRVRVI